MGILVLCLSACADDGINHQYVDMYAFEETAKLEKLFEENGLDYQYANNSVEQYQSIAEFLNKENMQLYRDALGITEVHKICSVLGYADFNDFLIKNGFVDEQGKPSEAALREAFNIYATKVMKEKLKR